MRWDLLKGTVVRQRSDIGEINLPRSMPPMASAMTFDFHIRMVYAKRK